MSKLAFLAVASALLLAGAAHAQPVAHDLTPQQQAQIETLLKVNTADILAAFKGEEKLRAELEQQLQAMNKLDEEQRKAALAKFQANYAARYRAVLAKGRIDLVGLAKRINAIAPQFELAPVGGTHLAGKRRYKKAAGAASEGSGYSEHRVPDGADFARRRWGGCQAIGGNGAAYTDRSSGPPKVRHDNWSAVAGGCRGGASLSHAYPLEAGYQAHVRASAQASASVFALGLLGAAYSTGWSGLIGGPERDTGIPRDGQYCTAMAPVLWAAGEDCEERVSLDYVDVGPSSSDSVPKITVYANTHSWAGGVVAGTSSKSSSDIREVVIDIGQR